MKRTVMKTFLAAMLACIFTSALWAQPAITSFTPVSGAVGTSVTISGSGFDGTPSNNIVYFGAVRATVTGGSTISLTVSVPEGATYGPITVTTGGLTAYSGKPFVVTFSALPIFDASVFAAKVDYSLSPSTGPAAVALGDIDGDGKPDLVTANSGTGHIRILRNTSAPGGFNSGSFSTSDTTYPAGTAPYGLALGDLDGDGDLDIVVSDTASGKVYVWQNGSSIDTVRCDSIYSFGVGTKPFGLDIADLDGDAQPDVIVALKGADSVAVLRNTSVGAALSFNHTRWFTGALTSPVAVQAKYDLDGDGILDVAALNSGNSRIAVLANGSFLDVILLTLSGTVITLGSGAPSFVLLDLDGDNKADIVSANQSANTVSLVRNANISSGAVVFAGKVDISAGTNPFAIRLGDMNGDGKPDVVVTNKSADSVSVLRNTSLPGAFTTSTLASPVQFATGDAPVALALGDVDGDGKPEILTANLTSGDISILRNKAIRDVAEAGNDSTSAVPMTVGETIQSVLTSSSDVDYFSVMVNPGDSVTISGGTVNNGNLYFAFDFIDTTGNYIKSRYERLDDTHQYFVYGPTTLSGPTKYFIRVAAVYYNYGYFPNSASNTPEPQMMPGSTAAYDSGFYRMSVERFAPAAPRVYYQAGVYNVSYNRARWWVDFYPNGLPTTASLEYSTSPDLSGSTTVSAPLPESGLLRANRDLPFGGLSPNAHYYFRGIATNGLGSAQTPVYDFHTPPSPVSWVHQNAGVNNTVLGISYSNDTTGVAVGYSGMKRRTTNGGVNWVPFPDSVGGNDLYSVWMVNSILGFAVGSNETIARTTDGGAHWTSLTNTSSYYGLWKVKFVNTAAGLAVGSGGLIIKTSNGGTNWTKVRQTDGYELFGVDYADLNTVVAVGFGGTVLRSSNGGATWDSIPKDPSWPYYMRGVDFPTSTTGYIIGDYAILKSTDAGLTWNAMTLPQNINLPWGVHDITFKDANNGLIVGEGGMILRTTDGGATWTREVTGTTTTFRSASYRGRSLAAGGENGLILSSLDPKDEAEPNEDAASATQIAYRDEVEARIDPADIDFYKFYAPNADTVAVFVESRDTAVVNGVLELYDLDGTTLLASNDDFVPGDSVRSRIVYILPAPGTYFVRYAGVSSAVSGDYRISLNRANLRPLVPFGGVATIVDTSTAILNSPVITNNTATTIEFQYGLTSAYGTTVAADQSGSASQQLTSATKTLTSLQGYSEYHFRVKATNAAGATYGPDVTFLTAMGMLRSETESNNISSAANTIFVGDTVQGTLSSNSDIDYFRFQAAAGDTLEIFVTARNASDLESKIQVIDSSGGVNQFVDNNYLPDSRSLHVAFKVTNTGVYHIRQSFAYNYNANYPNQAAPGPAPKMGGAPITPTSTTSSSGDYELRFRRFVPAPPDVRKYPWTDVAFSTSALIHADVTSNGRPTDVFVEYGTTQSLGSSVQYADGPVTTIGYQYWFRIPVNGLTPGTHYYFRLKAVNALGTSYSELGDFTTAPLSEKWTLKSPAFNQYLRDVTATNDSVALVLGEGRILRTTNAGSTWADLALPRWPYAVAFKDPDTAFAVSWSIIRSDDKGATWQFQEDLSNTYIEKIRFYSPQVGAIAGNYYNQGAGQWTGGIGGTSDGGQTWELKGLSPWSLVDASFISADTVRAISYNGWLYRTNNFSAASPVWDSVLIANEVTQGMKFIDGNAGIVVGSRIWRTTNGGTTWTQVLIPNSYLYDVAMKNAQVGVAVGGIGAAYRTTDGGASWTQEETGATTYLQAVSYVGRTAIAVGDVGTILYSIDPLSEVEPNNTAGTANAFAIGEQVEGSIESSGALDFYSFAAVAGDTLELLLTGTGGTPVNGALQLIGTDGSANLAQNDNFVAGDTSAARLVYVITAPGTYYIRVAGSGSGSTGTYLLELSRTSLRPHFVSASSSVSPTSATITAVIDPNNLQTTVRLDYGVTTSYGTSLQFTGSPILATQERKTLLKTITPLTDNTDFNFRVVATNAVDSVLSQNFTFHTPRASALAEAEPNDSARLAQEIVFSDSVNASIDTLTDVDYFKVRVASSDTLEVFITRRGGSQLLGRTELVDSATNGQRETNYSFPTDSTVHSILAFSNPGTLYIRQSYANNYNAYYPGVRDDDLPPVPSLTPTGTLQAASQDTGQYRLYVRKLVPSAPEGQSSVQFRSIFSDAMSFSTVVAPNGLGTTLNFEYGTSPQSYGSPIPAVNQPFNGIYRVQAFGPLITGLQPNTSYYVRTQQTNSAGSSYAAGVYPIITPEAPEGWTRLSAVTDFFIRGIDFPTESVGFAVGSSLVRKTTDGGQTWSVLTPAINTTFYSISFLTSSIGMIGGSGGTVQKTSDGGATWSQVASVGQTLFSIKMLGSNEAVGVSNGGLILRTINGGTSWDTVYSGARTWRALAFDAAGDSGYVAGYDPNNANPFVMRTTNRGATWQDVPTAPGSSLLLSVWCINGHTAVVGGQNRGFSRTSDGGATWTQSNPNGNGYYIYGIASPDTSNGVAVADNGGIFRTYDGGRNWTSERSGTYNLLFAAEIKGRSAFVAGNYGTLLKAVGLLAKPTNLTANFVSSDSVNVTWSDINGETGYFVERKTGAGGGYTRIRTLGANVASTVDTATPGRIYYYRVQAFDAVDTSLYSIEDSALVPLRRPTNLTATALAKTRVQLTWQNGADARLGYIIERNTGGPWSVVDTIAGATSYIDSTVSSGTSYSYKIKSYNADMVSQYSNAASTSTPGLVAAPSNLVSTYQDPNLVNITWADNASNETGYWVEKKTGAAGTYSLLRAVGSNATNTVDTIQRGRIYYYRVRGYSAADTSSYAAVDTALAPLYTPSNFVASTVSSSSIGLTWQNSSDARTGYKVERKSGGGSYAEITTIGNVSSYTDNTPASGTQYYYRLRSYTSELNSDYSNVDSALTALGKPQSITANPSSVTNGPIAISWSSPAGATHAWYSIDTPPGVGLATQITLTAKSFVLSGPPTGARWVYVALQNVEGVTDYAAYDSVQTRYDNVDPVITDQSVLPTIEITGTNVSNPASVNIQAQVVKPSGIANLLVPQLEYKKTNSATVTTVPFQNLGGGTLNLGNLNSLFLTIGKPNGLEYRITASDAAGNTAATIWKSFTVFVNTPPVSDFVPPAAGTSNDITALVTNYRLFSVPYDLSDKKPGSFMETIDKGLGPHAKDGVNYYHWRMQRYINATYQDYEDFKTLDVLTPGNAFFILSREQKTITVGIGNLVKASDMYNNGIQVFQGWNLIGNPFPDDFPADSMFVLAGSIANKAYYDGTGPDGGWYKTAPQINTLKKWEGLAVNVTQNTNLRFKAVPQTSEEEVPPVPMAMSAEQAIEEKKEGGWLLRIDAHRSGSPVVDIGNTIGEAPDAREGYDSFDSFQPPLIPGGSLAVYFKNTDGAMSSDIRPIQTNGSSWEMKVVTGDRGSRVKLDVSEVVALPGQTLEAYLLDIEDHMAHDLREKRNVEFGSKEGIRNFRIVVGSKGYVDSVSASLGIDLVPQVFMLYQNYPNPFNPETAVRFWLPGVAPAYKVTLKIYNILGQEVSTLIDRDMKAGYYETTFSGRNMASGMYIYRLTVDGGTKESSFSSVKKMVMVK